MLLTTFLMPVCCCRPGRRFTKKCAKLCIALLVLETGLIGTFLALDLFFFYVFWEVALIPMYLIVGIWGGDHRLYASKV